MILQELRIQTRLYHDRLEAGLDVFAQCRSLPDYARLLKRFYGFYAPAEDALAQGSVPARFQLERRRKTPLLALDLRLLEGATLGGQIIARHLDGPGDGPGTGAAVFNSYGPDTGRLWRSFGAVLTETVTDQTAQQAVIASACETFAALEWWLRPGPDGEGNVDGRS